MKKSWLCLALTGAMFVAFTAFTDAPLHAAKAKKQESEVQKALKDAYPDAQTQITGSSDVNGVKVYDVKVTTKQGDSTAQVTEYGDFLMYGVPHEYGAISNLISSNVAGLFKDKPQDVEMYRATDYYVDFKNRDNGKTFNAKFDAVGRLKDISNARETSEEAKAARGKEITDDASLKKAAEYVKREMPNAEVNKVYEAGGEGGFWYVQTKDGGDLIVNKGGQVLSLREPITKEDFPEPVAKTIQGMFNAEITKLWRGEDEYYQFEQKSQLGQPIVVKMRPNGDILEVRNDAARAEEQALQAKSKQPAAKSAKKKG
jgi:hypothetical protein